MNTAVRERAAEKISHKTIAENTRGLSADVTWWRNRSGHGKRRPEMLDRRQSTTVYGGRSAMTLSEGDLAPPGPRTGVIRQYRSIFDPLHTAFFGGSVTPAQHTRSTYLLRGWSVALELSIRELERSGSWQRQLQTSAEDAFMYSVLKHLA